MEVLRTGKETYSSLKAPCKKESPFASKCSLLPSSVFLLSVLCFLWRADGWWEMELVMHRLITDIPYRKKIETCPSPVYFNDHSIILLIFIFFPLAPATSLSAFPASVWEWKQDKE